ncbi:MAPK regulated corepressor interacting protein 2 [Sceloporus undulatus]|uniref:MAPK regulated corepressor interacting protein 2 n=1 Tax=Sceloporus undulatus TaxID=8520 RepID=UPI001C4D7C17|nr:MAPK regulated corepressor interacting protein 2 [Sceloporus undulatus]
MMYTITRGPSKLVTQRRTGPTQQVESKALELKGRRRAPQHQPEKAEPPKEAHLPSSWQLASPAPKLVFNRINGKRPPLTIKPISNTEESYTVAHEENVRFVYEAWQQVEQQLDDSQQGGSRSGPVQYVEKTPSPELKDFVPIDLEDWWAQQFLAKIENGS